MRCCKFINSCLQGYKWRQHFFRRKHPFLSRYSGKGKGSIFQKQPCASSFPGVRYRYPFSPCSKPSLAAAATLPIFLEIFCYGEREASARALVLSYKRAQAGVVDQLNMATMARGVALAHARGRHARRRGARRSAKGRRRRGRRESRADQATSRRNRPASRKKRRVLGVRFVWCALPRDRLHRECTRSRGERLLREKSTRATLRRSNCE